VVDVQTRKTDFLLQILDLSGERRLGDMQALGRTPVMFFLSNAYEIAQMAQLHLMPPDYRIDQNKILDVLVVMFPYSQQI
jgi:hypothetical protein